MYAVSTRLPSSQGVLQSLVSSPIVKRDAHFWLRGETKPNEQRTFAYLFNPSYLLYLPIPFQLCFHLAPPVLASLFLILRDYLSASSREEPSGRRSSSHCGRVSLPLAFCDVLLSYLLISRSSQRCVPIEPYAELGVPIVPEGLEPPKFVHCHD